MPVAFSRPKPGDHGSRVAVAKVNFSFAMQGRIPFSPPMTEPAHKGGFCHWLTDMNENLIRGSANEERSLEEMHFF